MVLGASLVPFRSHISVSTAALVLVIPVVVGAVIGGFVAGLISVVAGFLVYDFGFIPPYGTLAVGATQNWTALVVYAIVMVLVTRVVVKLESTREEAHWGNESMRRLAELSELLVGDRPVEDLLRTIVLTARTIFDLPGVTLLVQEDGRLIVAASAGEPLTSDELRQLDPQSGLPVSVGTVSGPPTTLRAVALSASGRPVGILAMRGLPESETDRAILNTFANDAALALERAQLRERAERSQLLEEIDHLRRGLMGAVSHDLRTPLATIKVASSTLANRTSSLSEDERYELYQLIEIEADRLTRLVTNLLDVTRIEAGVFNVHRVRTSIAELVHESVSALRPTLDDGRVEIDIPESPPDVDVDRLLIGQVLVNLLDNANRHSPPSSQITIASELRGDQLVLSVADQGPGVSPGDRLAVFDRFAKFDTGGRAGLGLAIAKTFIEAHGERIWYEEVPDGGARFVFSLPSIDNSEAGE